MKILLYGNFTVDEDPLYSHPESYFMNEWDEDTVAVINGHFYYRTERSLKKIDIDKPYFDELQASMKGLVLIRCCTDFTKKFHPTVEFHGNTAIKVRKNVYIIHDGEYDFDGKKLIVIPENQDAFEYIKKLKLTSEDKSNNYYIGNSKDFSLRKMTELNKSTGLKYLHYSINKDDYSKNFRWCPVFDAQEKGFVYLYGRREIVKEEY